MAVVLVWLAAALQTAGAVSYERDLKPLLRERCYSCHGALQQKATLRLDTVEAMRRGGKSGPALVPGQPDGSPLFLRVSADDLDERMPPEHEGQPFSEVQRAALREWILAGASGPDGENAEPDPREHWAFRPVIRPPVPAPQGSPGSGNPIDAFLARDHQANGLRPRPEAPRLLLVRRLYLDLVGVPPSAEELAAAESDPYPDWYERIVDRLLADPRHGQRWARHWMDIWRYSDAWGLGEQLRNSHEHLWHWRDWIVESLNADLPYDVMIRQMLAADETDPDDLNRLRATGFLARNYFLFNRHQWLDETVEHVAKGFLGLTLNCAKCHDHKYDPFSQVDYYRLRAVFEPYQVRTEMIPGQPDLRRDGIARAYDRSPELPTYRFIRGQETRPDTSVVIPPAVPALFQFATLEVRPVELPVTAWQPERRPWVIPGYQEAARARLESAEARRTVLRARPLPTEPGEAARVQAELVVADREVERAAAEQESLEGRVAWLRSRWSGTAPDPETHRAAVMAERRAALAALDLAVAEAELKWEKSDAPGREAAGKARDAAREKASNARKELEAPVPDDVAVTPVAGAAWVPTRFLDSTKDDPAAAFVPVSSGRRSALARWITDPRNPLTARVAVNHVWNRHMGAPLVATVFDFGRKGAVPADVELIDWLAADWMEHGLSLRYLHRRIVTSAAYRRSSSVAGAEAELARDPDNRWWWRRVPIRVESQLVHDSLRAHAGDLEFTTGGRPVAPGEQDTSRRRSLYFLHSNNDRNLFLTTFDEALVKECYRREQSIVPQQSLALLNSRLVHETAPRIASRISGSVPPGDDAAFVRESFRVLLGFEPSAAEQDAALRTLATWKGSGSDGSRERARANLVWALVNHGDFVTLR